MTEAPGETASPELEPFKFPPEHEWSEQVQAVLDSAHGDDEEGMGE